MNSTERPGWIRRIIALMLGLWLVTVLNSSALAATKITPPGQMIQQTTEEVLKLLREHQSELKQHPELIYNQVKDLVLEHFDFRLMSRFVLAQKWGRFSSEQRERFVDAFRELLVQTYSYSLSQYSGQTAEVRNAYIRSSGNLALVEMVIKQPGGSNIPVSYRLHKTAEGWKVYDVILAGVSLVQNYRSSFRSQIRREGIERFLDELQQSNAQSGL